MKTKDIIFTAVLATLVVTETSAEPINSKQALRNAQVFLQGKGIILKAQDMRRAPSANTEQEHPAFYVYNIGDREGFVVASGDDRVAPVLAYSDHGRMNTDELPDNVKFWLDTYKEQIACLKSNEMVSVRRRETPHNSVSPLLTTNWGQSCPFYNSCPINNSDGRRCVTGCVATAMAQVMYYHRNNSTRELMENLPNYMLDHGNVIVEGVEKGTPIDWDNIIDDYSGTYTPAQAKAVADLMFFCGSSVGAQYSTSSTGANSYAIPTALTTYFDYDEGVKNLARWRFTDQQWETMICEELEKGNPIIYSADESTLGGHCFVVDGHDGEGYVHINWGWDGDDDGYFLLTVSPEDDQKAMGGFDYAQCAVFGAVPNGAFPRLTNQDISLTGNTIIQNVSALSSIPISFSLRVANLSGGTNSFEQAVGLYMDNKFQRVISQLPDINGMAAGTIKRQDVSLSLESTLSQGVYTLVPLCRTKGSETWRKNIDYEQFITVVIHGDSAKLVVGKPKVEGEVINFASDETKRLCLKNWDANGDGELSKEEAASVQSLNNVFRYNSQITSFDELQYFTGLEAIESDAFNNCSQLTSVVIPKNVTSIGKWAFINCHLKKLFIPRKVVSIDPKAFSGNSQLEEICVDSRNSIYDSRNNCHALIETASDCLVRGCVNTSIPEDVITIGNSAFDNCEGLTTINLPESVTSIEDYAFENCKRLSSIDFPRNLTIIKDGAFRGCSSLEYFEFPQGLQEIGKGAFSGTAIDALYIPASVRNIQERAFNDCNNLRFIIVDEDNPYYDSRDECDAILETATDKLMTGCKSTVIPATTKSIGRLSFSYCRNLSTIAIPGSVEIIEPDAFQYCQSLREITIPEGVSKLGGYAFESCRELSKVSLPSTLTSLGSRTFAYCNAIRIVVAKMPEPLPIDDSETFSASSRAILYVPKGCVDKYKEANYWCLFKDIREIDVLKGDLNNDGQVTISDVTLIVRIIMGENNEAFLLEEADINGDGTVTVADVTAIVDIIL